MEYSIGQFDSANLGIMFFLIGWRINKHVPLLQRYSIPEPVTGGLLASLLLAVLHYGFNIDIEFNLTIRDWLLLYFFTTIGLNASFKKLVAGGPALFLLLALTVGFLFIQNLTGTFVAQLMGQNRITGLLGGTLSLVGGHGTVIAWAPELEKIKGMDRALEIGTACATFGLVLSSLLGGPIANYLVKRHKLEPSLHEQPDIGTMEDSPEANSIDYVKVLRALLVTQFCIMLGWVLDAFFKSQGITLPLFVSCLLVGIIVTNTIPNIFPKYPWPSESISLAIIADIALGIFLAMSLMSLELWSIMALALPILSILAVQTLVVTVFILFVIFPCMGKNYDAAVICSGFAGFSLGSTPTAIANMTSVTERYGASHKAFIVVPLVCSFFIDIANSIVVKIFL